MTRGSSLNLEIALSGVAAKVKPPTSFSARPKCVEASDDVIKEAFSGAPASCLLDFSRTRLGARYAKFFSRSHDAVIRVYDGAGNQRKGLGYNLLSNLLPAFFKRAIKRQNA